MEDFYETSVFDAQRFADLARQAVANGYTAFKSMAVPPTSCLEGLRQVNAAENVVGAMREAVGQDIDIMVDCHARQSPAMGLLFAQALDKFGLYFFEEPCWPEHLEGLARISASVATPIATGERLTHITQFRDLFAIRGCSVVQPDITHCGGLSAVRKVSALAEAYGIAVAPHNPQGPISTAAAFELGFSEPNFAICETVSDDVEWRRDVVTNAHPLDARTRQVTPSSKPGLGIEVNELEIAKHPFKQEELQRVFYRDGAVGDW
jgi:galactonate dehydratase